MSTLQIDLPPKLIPVFSGKADVRGAYGGRGSGKTRSFAKMTAVRALMLSQAGEKGIVLCGRQWQNSLEDSSLSEVKLAIESDPWLLPYFDIGEKYVKTRDGRISYSFSGLERNIDSVKSMSRILLCWVDEAEPVTEESWAVLLPTLREEGSELWVTWNPKRKKSATNKRFRETKDPLYKVVELNWQDNPKFPEKLNRERLRDLAERPESYGHVWNGKYVTAMDGAYLSRQLAEAREQGRIGVVPADPNLTIQAFADIGGTGARADNFVLWFAQFVGPQVRVLNHYEVQGQPLSAHLIWMREQKYTPGRVSTIWLPHDGDTKDRVIDVSYRTGFEGAGYCVEVVPNQGRGAASMRIAASRRIFPAVWFNEATTSAGTEALGWYHEKRDDEREIGLGPEHDWSSHSADAFGLMALVYESRLGREAGRPNTTRRRGSPMAA